MRKYGFAILVNHGVSQETFDTMNENPKEFFAMEIDMKMQYNFGAYGHPDGGYTPPGYEKVSLSTTDDQVDSSNEKAAKYDPVENFVFIDYPAKFGSGHDDALKTSLPLFTIANDYFHQMGKVLHTIHRLSAAALHLSDLEYLHQAYTVGKPSNALRLAHYPPLQSLQLPLGPSSSKSDIKSSNKNNEDAGEFDERVRYGAHTDYQGFTILKADRYDWHIIESLQAQQEQQKLNQPFIQCGGLEVFSPTEQRWIRVKIPLEWNALVISAGDLIERWTNGRWHSPLHRVINSSFDDSKSSSSRKESQQEDNKVSEVKLDSSRQSLVFFTGPADEVTISPIALPLTLEGITTENQVAKYTPIKSIDHLLMKLNRTNQDQIV